MDVLNGCYKSDPLPRKSRDDVTDHREIPVNRPGFIDNPLRIINRSMTDVNQDVSLIPCTQVQITGAIAGIATDDDLIPEMTQVLGKPGEESF